MKRQYGRRWQKARALVLGRQPVCPDPYSLHAGQVRAAAEVDHIIPHRGDPRTFWNALNLQGLCVECHRHKTALEASKNMKQRLVIKREKFAPENQPTEKTDPAKIELNARALVAAMTRTQPATPQCSARWKQLYEIADLMIESALPRLRRLPELEVAIAPYSAATLRLAQHLGAVIDDEQIENEKPGG